MENKVSAQTVYSKLKPFQLTPEQQRAVEQAPVDAPSMVVAGAGSGKTELMAVRVLWLVANGHCRPEEILGLTFTRKAASELGKRIYKSLLALRETELWPADLPYEFGQPTVTTYNSYANSIFRENSLALGMEEESALLTEAAAFQLAREVVVKYGANIDPRLIDLDRSLDTIIEDVIKLAGAMNDNLVSASQIGDVTADVVGKLANLPKKPGGNDFTQFAYYPGLLQPFPNTEIIAKLAEAYQAEKRKQGYVDYSDQVALAERAVRQLPNVGEIQRQRFRQVLLDEYQDTSVLQTKLLSGLFASQSVFAVGDPNQSIYGWRGASASNLANFALDFKGDPSSKFSLPMSWRNPTKVLTLANHLAEELKTPASYLNSDLPHLVPEVLTARDGAPDGSLLVKVDQTIEEEAASVATWFAHYKTAAVAAAKQAKSTNQESRWQHHMPTAAVLMRSKKWMQLFREAIEAEGLGVEVVGLGGLLEMSEITDLTSALKVIHDPGSGTELVRLLTGARWRIGAKDIDRLFRFAKNQNRFHLKEAALAPEDSVSLVDALDLLLDPAKAANAKFSDVTLARLQNAAKTFADLRAQAGMPLVEFVRLVERELWLDVEVMANPRRLNPMQHLNAFANTVLAYAQNNHRPHLGAFLKWLEFADERERLETPAAAPQPGVVQLLTIHASKGLEWSLVAVSNLAQGDFPSEGKGSSGWLTTGQLPYPLRGDSGSLPTWNYQTIGSQQDLKKSVDAFKDAVKVHQYREELRLVYVAVTRPMQALLLTGSYWKPGVKKAKALSTFLEKAVELPADVVEVVSRGEDPDVLPGQLALENPLLERVQTQSWPLDPLGENHGSKVRASRDLVLNALAGLNANSRQDAIELLLREREARALAAIEVPLPVRINASAFKDYLLKTEQTAQKMLRPLPQAPYQATRAGTLFHSIMEQRNAGLSSSLRGDAPGSDEDLDVSQASEDFWVRELETRDLGEHEQTIQELQANFAKSRWSGLIALEAEVEIQMALGNNIFICKLDAVFQTSDGGVEIVDWKTGTSPTTAEEIEERSLQLSLYRVAYSVLRGVPLEKVTTCLYYVSENREVRPDQHFGLEDLAKRWPQVYQGQSAKM